MFYLELNLYLLENCDKIFEILIFVSTIFLTVIIIVNTDFSYNLKKQKKIAAMSFVGCIIVIMLCIFMTTCYIMLRNLDKSEDIRTIEIEKNKYIQYESNTLKEDCRLCGENSHDYGLLSRYWGENNVGIINLNTFDFHAVEINRYDDKKNLIENKAGYSYLSNQLFQKGDSVLVNHDRGYAEGKITITESTKLSLDKLKYFLCSDCLTDLMNKYRYNGEQWNIGLINFEDRTIIPFEEWVSGFSSGDFYIWCKYKEDANTIDLLILYCPVRYSP